MLFHCKDLYVFNFIQIYSVVLASDCNFSDVVDWVLENLIDNTRSRRALLKKMKELYLLTDYKKGKVRTSKKVQMQWTSEEEEQLTELYEQFKDAMGKFLTV